ncbi:MAG: hypothetical protein Q9167_004279 [Letrouitia subvulpina]
MPLFRSNTTGTSRQEPRYDPPANPPIPLTPTTASSISPTKIQTLVYLLSLPPGSRLIFSRISSLPRSLTRSIKTHSKATSLPSSLAAFAKALEHSWGTATSKTAECELCDLHVRLRPQILLHLVSLLSYEMHEKLEGLLSMHPAIRSETTNRLLASIARWRRQLQPGERVDGCMACLLASFFNDQESARALTVMVRSRFRKGKPKPALIEEGWLAGTPNGQTKEVKDVRNDRNLIVRMRREAAKQQTGTAQDPFRQEPPTPEARLESYESIPMLDRIKDRVNYKHVQDSGSPQPLSRNTSPSIASFTSSNNTGTTSPMTYSSSIWQDVRPLRPTLSPSPLSSETLSRFQKQPPTIAELRVALAKKQHRASAQSSSLDSQSIFSRPVSGIGDSGQEDLGPFAEIHASIDEELSNFVSEGHYDDDDKGEESEESLQTSLEVEVGDGEYMYSDSEYEEVDEGNNFF